MARATRSSHAASAAKARQPEPEPEPEPESEGQEDVPEDNDDDEAGEEEEANGEDAESLEQIGTQPLQFDEPLTWRAGKPIAVGELLRRLKKLQAELVETDQDEAERESFIPVAQELAHANLLHHNDNGIKARVAACIVEVLRIMAPDAPYKPQQLKVRKLRALSETVADQFTRTFLRFLSTSQCPRSEILPTPTTTSICAS